MRAFNRCLGLLAASLMLASCGGGGGSGGDGAFQPTPSGTLTITATTTSLPMNRLGTTPFPGSPFISEVDVTWRRANGDLVSGQEVAVSINPVTIAAFSTLDDPSTPEVRDQNGVYVSGNEFRDRLGSGPVDVTGGHATIFVHSAATAGVATLTVTARDSTSNTTISKTLQFTVNNVASSLPASITADATPNHVYLQETGGSNSTVITALVLDGGENYVPDPGSGNSSFNNVQLEVVGGANYGTLSALGAGGSNTGVTVKTRTVQGIATAAFRAGTIQGPVQIRIIADRADNNVDNGISDALVATISVIVSDGKLFSLAITSPTQDAITTGNITGTVGPNGTYSLVVSALATDRQGNPVPAGTAIRFGAIDGPATGFPQDGPGIFLIRGTDGDPLEGGTLFTSLTGCFTGFIKPTDPRCTSTGPGERPGPGDTLLVFGDLVLGNRDLESARTITTINTSTSLNVSVPFNRNDDSGNSVNSGPVLPYVIGRAIDANIRDSGALGNGVLGVTNENGVATAVLNYPNNKLGKLVYLFAQGDGVGAAGNIKKVTDIGSYRFAGIADLVLTANPESISANSTAAVTVCVVDALGAPMQGLAINFGFASLPAGGQGFVDNIAGSGVVEDRTGTNGCAVALVRTIGINSSGSGGGTSAPRVVFSVGDASDTVEITAGGAGSLTAAPSHFVGSGGTITLTLRDSAGNPVPGVNIDTQCTGDVSIVTPAGVTNAQGQTTAVINGDNLNDFGNPGEGTCTFTAASGEETEVTFEGIDLCASNVSPPPPPELCGGTTTPIQLTVAVTPTAAGPTACGLTVSSNPSGIACSAPAGGGTVSCNSSFAPGTAVQLSAVPTGVGCPAAPGRTVTFSGGCAQSGPGSANVTLNTPQTCAATVTVP